MTEQQHTAHSTRAISAKGYGQRYSLSQRTIFRLSAAGKLPRPVRIGGAVRWLLSDIELWERMNCPTRQEFETRSKQRGAGA